MCPERHCTQTCLISHTPASPQGSGPATGSSEAENDKMREMMGEIGVSPRPTVAQWLQQKQQRKRAM